MKTSREEEKKAIMHTEPTDYRKLTVGMKLELNLTVDQQFEFKAGLPDCKYEESEGVWFVAGEVMLEDGSVCHAILGFPEDEYHLPHYAYIFTPSGPCDIFETSNIDLNGTPKLSNALMQIRSVLGTVYFRIPHQNRSAPHNKRVWHHLYDGHVCPTVSTQFDCH